MSEKRETKKFFKDIDKAMLELWKMLYNSESAGGVIKTKKWEIHWSRSEYRFMFKFEPTFEARYGSRRKKGGS